MADDLGRASQYRSEYRKMSLVAHPSLRATTWYSMASEADVDLAQRGEPAPVPIVRQPATGMVHSVALMLALVVARALDPAELAFGNSLAADRQRLLEPLSSLAATRDDLTQRDHRAEAGPGAPPEL
jgi:hypothetical protein